RRRQRLPLPVPGRCAGRRGRPSEDHRDDRARRRLSRRPRRRRLALTRRPRRAASDRPHVHPTHGRGAPGARLRGLAARRRARPALGKGDLRMRRLLGVTLLLALVATRAAAQAPVEGELTLITPVSKFIHDAALKAFAEYAKEKWNVTVKTNAIPA